MVLLLLLYGGVDVGRGRPPRSIPATAAPRRSTVPRGEGRGHCRGGCGAIIAVSAFLARVLILPHVDHGDTPALRGGWRRLVQAEGRHRRQRQLQLWQLRQGHLRHLRELRQAGQLHRVVSSRRATRLAPCRERRLSFHKGLRSARKWGGASAGAGT